MNGRGVLYATLLSLISCGLMVAAAAQAPTIPPTPGVPVLPPKPPTVEKLGSNLYRVGEVRVDTSRREVTITGKVNPHALTLEFLASPRTTTWREYETALTLDTDAITFNAALVLIGLDRSRTRGVPTTHFDLAVTEGDGVEITVECPGGECSRMPAERLIFDQKTAQPISGGTWVYTGSSFLLDGRYRAETDGVLIGFVHDPSTIIEYSIGAGLGRYGSIVLNPNLNLVPGTQIKMTVKAIGQTATR